MSKIISLQTKLVKTSLISSIIAGMIALFLFILISIYQAMQVQDEIMDEIADMLLISDLTSNAGQQVDELSEQFDIQYQLLHDKLVLTQSEDFHSTISKQQIFLDLDHHYGFIWENNQLLRSYLITDTPSNTQVLVVQPLAERFKELFHSVFAYSLILLTLWLLQWLMLYILMKRQFKVVHQLSADIAQKHADDLNPIDSKASELKELQPIILQLNQLLQRLDQSLTAEQRFTSDASHELRSPLSAIQMRLQLLQRKHPNLADEFNIIQTDVNRGTQVLENLLLLARLDPEQADHLPKTKFQLDILLQELQQNLRLFANAKRVNFIQNIDFESKKYELEANQDLIFICIRNLLDNAIRYSPENRNIQIQLTHHNIGQLSQNTKNQIRLSIENEGEILNQETINRLGERFYRVLGTKTQGSGLGISISKKIIDLHDGSLEFYALPNGGLRVICYLPIAS